MSALFHPKGPTLRELARQALSSTDRGYELLAEKFDYTPYRTPALILEAVGRRLDELGPFAAGLDLCCGTGAGVDLLARSCTERVVGVDRVPAMLEQAARNLGLAPGAERRGPTRPAIDLVEGDALRLPASVAEAEFDVATCFGAFGHIEERDEPAFVAEVFRALGPRGRFVFATTTMPRPDRREWWLARGFNLAMRVRNALWRPPFIMYYLTFTLPRARALLEQAGFEVDVSGPLFGPPRDLLRVVVATKPARR